MDERKRSDARRALVAAGAAAGALSMLVGIPVLAQHEAAYDGVVPGAGHPPRHAAVQRHEAQPNGRPALLSWVGFRPMDGGGSRFFLQLSRPVPHTVRSSAGRFEVLLPQTRVHLRNTWRPVETRFFNTPVLRARVERRGRSDLAVVFQLRADVTPRISEGAGQDGYHFVYVDWPAGDYAPAPSEPAAAPPGGSDTRFESEQDDGSTGIRVYQGAD